MHTFILGIIILFVGGAAYGHFCQNVFGPDDRKTPAFTKQDGVDFVPMPKWKNALINLLNIAGTGPILGPIQGILFGPIAFIAIPIGCVIGGAMHDYFCGMISVREGGIQMPEVVKRNTDPVIHKLYTVFVCIVLFLIGVVFIYTPGDIAATQVFGFGGTAGEASTWIIYSVIFVYYLIATLFPIDKIIGRIYPIFGAVLLLSAVGVFVMLFTKHYNLLDMIISDQTATVLSVLMIPVFAVIAYVVIAFYYKIAIDHKLDKVIGTVYFLFGIVIIIASIGILVMLIARNYNLVNIWDGWALNGFDFGAYFRSQHFIPTFFVTVACGILSGFHSTQITLVTRTVQSEKEGRFAFYNMMIAEGFIAMVWAAGTMAMIGVGAENMGITMQMTETGVAYSAYVGGVLQRISATSVVGVVCRNMLGQAGGLIAIIGVIILPITSGDTALRSLRLILADALDIKQEDPKKRILLSLPVFAAAYLVLIWAKNNANGFNTIWRYFGWSNQTLAVFALASITIWLMRHGKKKYLWVPLIPLVFYAFITCSYLMSASIGFSLPYRTSFVIGAVFAMAVGIASIYCGKLKKTEE